jgi:hypothetical protein
MDDNLDKNDFTFTYCICSRCSTLFCSKNTIERMLYKIHKAERRESKRMPNEFREESKLSFYRAKLKKAKKKWNRASSDNCKYQSCDYNNSSDEDAKYGVRS